MDQMEISFERYLKEALGICVRLRKWKETEKLPFFLRNLYVFFQAPILDTSCLAIFAKDEIEQTPATIRKHILQVQKKWHHEIIYVQRKVSAYNRKRLIEHKVPFVIPGNQMYLPFLGIDLREHFKKIRNKEPRCSPSTQTVVLYALLHDGGSRFTPKKLANRLGYTAMTMTRALDELKGVGLGEIAMEGRERTLRFDRDRKALWENALKTLRSPVKKRLLVKHSLKKSLGVEAGLSALAHYSALAQPENPVFALEGKKWKGLKTNKNLRVLEIREPGACELEIWSYPPELFAKDGVVDPFSLYLSMQAVDDERVELALEEMMEQAAW
jgi:DNA-binding MarR family transcriptional regulator